MINRAYTHCNNPQSFEREMRIIKNIIVKHGYEENLINKIKKDLRKKSNKNIKENESRNNNIEDEINNKQKNEYKMVPHQLTGFRNVKNILKKNNKKPAYKRPPTIFELLRNVKDNYTQLEKTGVYSIPLKNLDDNPEELYIGATSRNLKERLSEHERDIKNAT